MMKTGAYSWITLHYCAKNAIDEYYGDFGEHGDKKRKPYGIQIIGAKNSTRMSL